MRISFKNVIPAFSLTILIFVLLEIIVSAVLPMFGLTNVRLPFNVLIILYFGFRFNSPYLAIIILLIQVVHGLFSVEGWAIGTITGIFITILISYLKDMINLSSKFVTSVITQIFMIAWLAMLALLLYVKSAPMDYITAKLWRFLPESFLVSLIAPFLFPLFDKIWNYREEGQITGDV
jgi:hypothetical protein